MPYIADLNIRKALDNGDVLPRNAGELNYCITRSFIKNGNMLNIEDIERCVNNFILAHKIANKKMDYQAWNDVFGALECARLEGYRRGWFPLYNTSYGLADRQYKELGNYIYTKYVANYEDKKIVENSDVV